MKHWFTVALIIVAFHCIAQPNTNEKLDQKSVAFSNQLLSQTDSVLLYTAGCNGCVFNLLDMCGCDEVKYVIWQDTGHTKIMEISCCGEHEYNLPDNNVWSMFSDEAGEILDSKFYTSYPNNHYSYDVFELITRQDKRRVEIYDYYFVNPAGDNNHNEFQPAKLYLDEFWRLFRQYRD